MSRKHLEEELKKIADRIIVLESEKVDEKYIKPLYTERSKMIQKWRETNE
jgi:hypothetical protein